MTNTEAEKILEYVKFYYGDCNCDLHTRCKFCSIETEVNEMVSDS